MKKYSICFFAIYCLCFVLLYLIYPDSEEDGYDQFAAVESSENIGGLAEAGAAVVDGLNADSDDNTESVSNSDIINFENGYNISGNAEENLNVPSYTVCGGISEILIFYPDPNTVYKRIPIVPEELSDDDRMQLSIGISFDTLDELYHYLESITS